MIRPPAAEEAPAAAADEAPAAAADEAPAAAAEEAPAAADEEEPAAADGEEVEDLAAMAYRSWRKFDGSSDEDATPPRY